jgi:aspartate/methionine/tyrosine aminotransferase
MNINKISQTASVFLADIVRKIESNGDRVIKFQTGDPCYNTHPAIIEKASESLRGGDTHYSFAQGLPELRSIIADNLNFEINGTLDLSNVLITQGAAQAIFSIFTTILEQGDEVLVLEPNWTTVDSAILLNGGKPIKINFLDEVNLFKEIKNSYSYRTKAIILNVPNNPTGKVLSQTTLDLIIDWAIANSLFIISDEVYRYLQYDTYTTTLNTIGVYEKYIFVDSFSKKFAMTGWRIGYIAASKDIITTLLKASQITITHVAPFIQKAAIEALTNPEIQVYCELMKKGYYQNKIFVQNALMESGIDFIFPEGAFYFFIKLNRGMDDISFAKYLLENEKVCVVPGSAYGSSGSGFIRISYSIEFKDLELGLEKIVKSIVK